MINFLNKYTETIFKLHGGQTKGVDLNGDDNKEYTLNKCDSGGSFEIFDFNSDGIKDMDMHYNKDNEFTGGNFYDKDGNIYQPTPDEVKSYLEQAEILRESAKDLEFEEQKGYEDIMMDINKKYKLMTSGFASNSTDIKNTNDIKATDEKISEEDLEKISEELDKIKNVISENIEDFQRFN